jgi:aspartate/methionine/tyrosine aminotransferase
METTPGRLRQEIWKSYLRSLNQGLDRWGEFDAASNPDGIICLGADSGWSYAHDMAFFHTYLDALATGLAADGSPFDEIARVLSETLGYYSPKTLDVALLRSAIEVSHGYSNLCGLSRFQPLVNTTVCRSLLSAAALVGDLVNRSPVAFVGSAVDYRQMLPILNAIGSPIERVAVLAPGVLREGRFSACVLPGYAGGEATGLTSLATHARAAGAKLPLLVEIGSALTDRASVLTLPSVRHFAIRIVPLPSVHASFASLAFVIGSATVVKRLRELQGAFNAFPSAYEQRLTTHLMLDNTALSRVSPTCKPARRSVSARLGEVFTTEVLERASLMPSAVSTFAVSHSAQFLLSELVDVLPGRYVLMPTVCVPFMAHAIEAKGAAIRYFDPWRSPAVSVPEDTRTDPPKFLWLNIPVNPTGALYNTTQYQAITDWCTAHGVLLVEDHDIHFLYSHPLEAERSTKGLRRVRVYTFSKEFGLPLEFGLAVGDKDVLAGLERQLQLRGANCPGLKLEALTSALKVLGVGIEDGSIARCISRIRTALLWAVDQFEMAGFEVVAPEAGAKFLVRGASGCVLPKAWLDFSSAQLSLELLNRSHISLTPADCYGSGLNRWLRVVIDKPVEHVEAMFARLRALV